MAENKIKIVNPQKFDIGVKTLDRPMGINVQAGSFILASEDDVNYITSICTFIQRGLLRLDNVAGAKEDIATDMLHSIGVNPDEIYLSDEDIRKNLGMSLKKMNDWLDTVTEKYMRDRIADIAIEMNLPMNKVAALQKRMPERSFINIDD